MMDVAVEDGDGPVEATLITSAPAGLGFTGEEDSTVDRHEDDAPTVSREGTLDQPTNPARPGDNVNISPPAALAAKIHAPAISELRKPRPSRRTPAGGGVRQPNVLHAIVSSQASEPMPAPRPPPRAPLQSKSQPLAPLGQSQPLHGRVQPTPAGQPQPLHGRVQPTPAGQPQPLHGHVQPTPAGQPQLQPMPVLPSQPMAPTLVQPTQGAPAPLFAQTTRAPALLPATRDSHPSVEPFAPQFSVGGAGGQMPYSDGSGPSPGFATPPGVPANPAGVPPHLAAAYPMQQVPPGYPQPQLATQMSPHGYPTLMPGALYQFQTPPQEMSLTGQMRAAEIDELPAHYKLGAARARWFTYIVSGVLDNRVNEASVDRDIRAMRDVLSHATPIAFRPSAVMSQPITPFGHTRRRLLGS